MRYNVRFFRPEEFICPCCGRGSMAYSLVFFLDLFRAAWGAPVRVNSGYRCEAHNKEVGGATASRHLLGCAADIAPFCWDIGPFKSLARRMFSIPGWELKEYAHFVHVAVPRDEAARAGWNGNPILFA